MMVLYSTALEVAAAAVVLVPLYVVFHKVLFRNGRKSMVYCVFSLYLAAVYVLVGMPNVTYIRMELNLNIVPFLGIIEDLKNSILNVILFVPLGFMLPVVWKKFRTRRNTVLFGFGMSLTVELLQILTFRATDINDVITNVLGTLLGFVIADILMKNSRTVKELINEKKSIELYMVCAVVLVVMFFVHPFLSKVMWELTYR